MENYPPELDGEQLIALTSEVKDWQLTHGSLIKLVFYEDTNTVPGRPIGAAVFPTPFPSRCFEEACQLAPIFNKLYAAVSEDDHWLYNVLEHQIHNDPLVEILWDIHQTAKRVENVQDLRMGIFRADYMLHSDHEQPQEPASLKQVEVNTVSVAGGVHSNIISDMHHHLNRSGAYDFDSWCSTPYTLPQNNTIKNIVLALSEAHKAYGPPTCSTAREKCILIVVQPFNINICDERPLEYNLWDQNIPTYRICFGEALSSSTTLGPNQELLFTHPTNPNAKTMEVSVVYWRAGFSIEEYDSETKTLRLLIEKSKAVKCPSIPCHLATLKCVQQALTSPQTLSRFLTPQEVSSAESVFMSMYPLDTSPSGLHARNLATDPTTAEHHVLKPNLEGGGNNVFRKDIPGFLARIPEEKWRDYVLMRLITPPHGIENTLVSWTGLYRGPVASELGVFGCCLWRRSITLEREKPYPAARGEHISEAGIEGEETPPDFEMLRNVQAGFSFKTKSTSVDEMSVVKGYGCFDSPLLF